MDGYCEVNSQLKIRTKFHRMIAKVIRLWQAVGLHTEPQGFLVKSDYAHENTWNAKT